MSGEGPDETVITSMLNVHLDFIRIFNSFFLPSVKRKFLMSFSPDDNASCYRTRSIQTVFYERHSNTMTEPANSQEINPIGHFCWKFRKKSMTRLQPAKLICQLLHKKVGN